MVGPLVLGVANRWGLLVEGVVTGVGGSLDTKISPMSGGPVVGLQKKLPAAQGKMKMTWENIAYDQGGGRWTSRVIGLPVGWGLRFNCRRGRSAVDAAAVLPLPEVRAALGPQGG
jgi:hypothetical protein